MQWTLRVQFVKIICRLMRLAPIKYDQEIKNLIRRQNIILKETRQFRSTVLYRNTQLLPEFCYFRRRKWHTHKIWFV